MEQKSQRLHQNACIWKSPTKAKCWLETISTKTDFICKMHREVQNEISNFFYLSNENSFVQSLSLWYDRKIVLCDSSSVFMCIGGMRCGQCGIGNLCTVGCSQKSFCFKWKNSISVATCKHFACLLALALFPIIGFCVDFQHEKIDIFAREIVVRYRDRSNWVHMYICIILIHIQQHFGHTIVLNHTQHFGFYSAKNDTHTLTHHSLNENGCQRHTVMVPSSLLLLLFLCLLLLWW